MALRSRRSITSLFTVIVATVTVTSASMAPTVLAAASDTESGEPAVVDGRQKVRVSLKTTTPWVRKGRVAVLKGKLSGVRGRKTVTIMQRNKSKARWVFEARRATTRKGTFRHREDVRSGTRYYKACFRGRCSSKVLVRMKANSQPKLAPGRFGPVKVGMSVRSAERTGFFDKVPDKLCGQELTFKARWARRGLGSYIYRDGVESVAVAGTRIQTTQGARVGTTLGRLRMKYPGLVGPEEVQWIDGPAWWAHVRKGDRYLTFFMNSPAAPHSPPNLENTVKYMAVSKTEPGGFGSGC